jgi:hypothetical protein
MLMENSDLGSSVYKFCVVDVFLNSEDLAGFLRIQRAVALQSAPSASICFLQALAHTRCRCGFGSHALPF